MFNTKAYIYSLNKDKIDSTVLDEVTILGEKDGKIIAEYKGKKYYAILNGFNFMYYVDDLREVKE